MYLFQLNIMSYIIMYFCIFSTIYLTLSHYWWPGSCPVRLATPSTSWFTFSKLSSAVYFHLILFIAQQPLLAFISFLLSAGLCLMSVFSQEFKMWQRFVDWEAPSRIFLLLPGFTRLLLLHSGERRWNCVLSSTLNKRGGIRSEY